MTEPTYLLTGAQRNAQIEALTNSKEAIATSIHFGVDKVQAALDISSLNDAIAMLQSLPMVTTTPKAYILQNSEDSHKKLSWVENDDCENIPLFTSPQALQNK